MRSTTAAQPRTPPETMDPPLSSGDLPEPFAPGGSGRDDVDGEHMMSRAKAHTPLEIRRRAARLRRAGLSRKQLSSILHAPVEVICGWLDLPPDPPLGPRRRVLTGYSRYRAVLAALRELGPVSARYLARYLELSMHSVGYELRRLVRERRVAATRSESGGLLYTLVTAPIPTDNTNNGATP